MNIPILMYHGIHHLLQSEPSSLAVNVKEFEKQMKHLRDNGYTSMLMRDLALNISSKSKLPKKPFVITFDDAPASIMEYAYPVLNRLGFKAAVFVVTSAIGLHNTWDDGKPVPRTECMKLGEIQTLLDLGWEIGSHTNSHAELQTLMPDKLKEEVFGSKNELEKLFSTRIESFCYPYGGCNELVRQAVVNAGYTSACVISAKTGSVTEDLFRLKRVFVKPEDSLFTFKRKVAPWYLMLRGIKKR